MSMRASTRNVLSICAAALLALSVRGRAQATCPAPRKPSDCAARVPGTPLPFVNKAAPLRLDLKGAKTVDLVILGHSESRGYHSYLLPLLKQQPPIPGVTFNVSNRFIGGHEAWRWATPGQRGYKTIQSLIQNPSNPIIVLGLFSNNVSFPIRAPSTKDANYVKFADNLEKIADLLHNGGKGVLMTYLSAHRYKPKNLLPSYYENCAIRELMARASSKRKAYLKAGPEQHDLHWCCYPQLLREGPRAHQPTRRPAHGADLARLSRARTGRLLERTLRQRHAWDWRKGPCPSPRAAAFRDSATRSSAWPQATCSATPRSDI